MSDINLNGGSKKIILNGTTYFASGGGGGYTPTLITKTITENGTYSAEDDSADGYSEVTVDVPTPKGGNIVDDYVLKLSTKNLMVPYAQSSGNMTVAFNSSNQPYTIFVSGSNIGASFNGNVDLNIAGNGFTQLNYKIKATSSYDYTHGQNIRPLVIGITDQIRTGYVFVQESTASQYFKRYQLYDVNYARTEFTGTVNLSGLTGNNYLLIVATGWDMTVEELELV